MICVLYLEICFDFCLICFVICFDLLVSEFGLGFGCLTCLVDGLLKCFLGWVDWFLFVIIYVYELAC